MNLKERGKYLYKGLLVSMTQGLIEIYRRQQYVNIFNLPSKIKPEDIQYGMVQDFNEYDDEGTCHIIDWYIEDNLIFTDEVDYEYVEEYIKPPFNIEGLLQDLDKLEQKLKKE